MRAENARTTLRTIVCVAALAVAIALTVATPAAARITPAAFCPSSKVRIARSCSADAWVSLITTI